MLIVINAFKSIVRSKGRNILIGIIVLTIAISSCIALSIRSSADKAKEAGLDSINITASIGVDRQKIMESAKESSAQADMDSMRELMDKYSPLSLTKLKTYADSTYVKDFYYSSSASLNGAGKLEAFSEEGTSSGNESAQNQPGGPSGLGREGMVLGDFSVVGYGSESAMTQFISGTSKITDGEMFDVTSSAKNCLISSDLATYNDLKVGDKIKLADPNDETETFKFTITGIYTTTGESDNKMSFAPATDPSNLICVSYSALKGTGVTGQLSGIFTFENKTDYDHFSDEVAASGLSKYYQVTSSDISNYEASLVPLENLSNFATTMLLIVLGVGGVILIVLNIFNIRERKFEVGVLTAIGIKKGKVALQFVTELLVVTLVAITIGTAIGAVASVPASNGLLASQISAQQTTVQEQNQNFGREGQPGNMVGPGREGMQPGSEKGVTYLDTINATTDLNVLSKLMGIGLLLTMVSSLGAVVFVLRYEPLEILSSRA